MACCGELRTPVANGIRDLVMQRQPTPQVDTKRKGHFLSRDQSLVESANTPSLVVNLSALPSAIADPLKVDTRKKTARDTKLAKDLKLKSWDAKKVRGVLQCYHCAKPRASIHLWKTGTMPRQLQCSKNWSQYLVVSLAVIFSLTTATP